jgi:hypothetical protein
LCQEKSGNPGLGRKNVVASWERSIWSRFESRHYYKWTANFEKNVFRQ